MQGTKPVKSTTSSPIKKEKLYVETSNLEIKSVVVKSYELEYRRNGKTEKKCLPSSNYGETDARNNIIARQSELLQN